MLTSLVRLRMTHCRICIKMITDTNFLLLKSDDLSKIKMQLSICVPEMVVDLVRDPVYCESCVSALDSAYNFKNLCLRTEKYIQNYSRKMLRRKSIDIKNWLAGLQQSTVNNVSVNNGEGEITGKEDFAVTPDMKLALSDEDLVAVQSMNTESSACQQSETLPIDACKASAIQTALDKLNSLLDHALANAPTEPRVFKSENENKDITKEEEDHIHLPKVELILSNEDSQDSLCEDAMSDEAATFDNEVVNENDGSIFQTNLVTQNCFVKLTRLPESIVCNTVNTLEKVCTTAGKRKVTKKYYKCDKCGYSAKYRSNLKRHSLAHSTSKAFSCSLCEYRTKQKHNLEKHKEIHNSDPKKLFSCLLCAYKTNNKYNLETHKRRRHSGKRKFTTGHENFLKQHKSIYDERKHFACNVCNCRFAQKSDLQKHLRIHTSEKPFACNVCTYRAAKKWTLQLHLRIHTGNKPFACNVCNRRFVQKSDLSKHLRIHTGEKPFACNVCNRRFAQKCDLPTHLRIHTGEKPFACNVCTYRAAKKSNLQLHLRIHTGEKPFACNVCNSRFVQKSNLQKHLRIHTGEKPFACNVCNHRFVQKSNLQKHLRIYTGEKPFACNVCNRRFAQKCDLPKHLRIHTGEKPFACNVCNRRFVQKSNLQKHLRIYTGEKPFACNVCNRRFAQKCDLPKHLRIHTGEKPFACNVCNRRFVQKSNLQKHLQVHS